MRERDIFDAALAIADPAERSAYLAKVSAGNQELRQHIEGLLDMHAQLGNFLEAPACPLGATVDGPVHELPGTVIGPYKLLEQIGEGGMGLVFMAEQSRPVRRRVALKIIKPGMDTRQVVVRFEAERQALALMDHPNIAKVFDAGATDSGRPYFVMELVRGVPITEFCDQRRLSTRQRLELFVTVCQAVQHAHQKGIIHRDLKPSNVLVTLHDTIAVPKIIDFGIAKATTGPLTERTLFTHFSQMIGTPLYMSPEQAEMNGLDVDTRSDVYALGVLLYELLTGTTPFESQMLKKVGLDEMRRLIREEEPPTPSQRLSTLAAQVCETVSERRGVDGRRLGQMLRGELDWIVMKALEKDRNRRYESASALAAEVQRYLNDEPVLACSPSAGYRLRKFARRHNVALVTIGMVAGALLLGTAGSVWQAVEAQTARKSAEQERDAARGQRKRARQAVDKMYTQVAERWLAVQPGMEKLRMEFLRDALEYYREFAQEPGTDAEEQFEIALAHQRVGRILLFGMEQRPEAGEALQSARIILARLVEEFPDKPAYLNELAKTLAMLGYTSPSPEQTEKLQRQAIALWEKAVAAAPGEPVYHVYLAGCLNNLVGSIHTRSPEEADLLLRRAIGVLEKMPPDVSPTSRRLGLLILLSDSRGCLLAARGRLHEAIECMSKGIEEVRSLTGDGNAVPTYHNGLQPGDWLALGNEYKDLGRLLRRTRKNEQAWAALQSAIRIHERLVTDFPESPVYVRDLQGDYQELGLLEQTCGRTAEAERLYRKALQLLEQLHHRQGAEALPRFLHFLLTCPASKLRDPSRAAALAKEWVAQHPRNPTAWQHLAQALYQTGKYEEALEAAQQARHMSADHAPETGFLLAMIHWQLGDKEKARQCWAEAAAWLEKTRPGDEELCAARAEAAALLGVGTSAAKPGKAPLPGH